MAARVAAAKTVDVQLVKKGPGGRPAAEVLVPANTPLNAVAGLVQKHVTRNADVLRKLGLSACPACISGFDIWIRYRYDDMLRIDLKQIG